jgi:hypothetical protein
VPLNGFFYKYNPLSTGIAKNDPLPIVLTKMAWRKMQTLPRVTSRHLTWRTKHPAILSGGKAFPPLALAEPAVC